MHIACAKDSSCQDVDLLLFLMVQCRLGRVLDLLFLHHLVRYTLPRRRRDLLPGSALSLLVRVGLLAHAAGTYEYCAQPHLQGSQQ